MSNTFAIDLPDFDQASYAPGESTQHPRHIEIVSTRSQKRARPRVVYALVAVAGLFLILVAQLLLSIWLSHGAYEISTLQATQKNLARDQASLTESMDVLQSPQNLAARAAALGMVTNTGSQGFLRLSDSTVTRAASAATADTTLSPTDAGYAPNALITPEISSIGAAEAAAAAGVAANPAVPGAPATAAATGSVASTPGALPSPVTH